jgi:hypothetical protein
MSNTFSNNESNASVRAKLNANTLIVEDKVVGTRYASTQKNTNAADTVTISAGEINTYKLLPLTFDYYLVKDFTAITNGLRYDNPTTRKFVFHGVSTVSSSAPSTEIHFALGINGTILNASQSVTETKDANAKSSIAGVIIVELDNVDNIKVYVKANKACTVSAFHTALTLCEV